MNGDRHFFSFEFIVLMEKMANQQNVIKTKSYRFALSIIGLYKELKEKNEYIISKQIIRSGTSIGANVEEAGAAQSRKDFISKMSIASKEARETHYWLRLLKDSNLCPGIDYTKITKDSEEIIKILTSIVKTSKRPN